MTRPTPDPENDTMLDFQEILAGELRAAAEPAAATATLTGSAPRVTTRRWFRAVGALGVPAVAATVAGVFFLAPDRAVVASANPPVLQAPQIDPSRFHDNPTLRAVLGPGAVAVEAYEVPIDTKSAFLFGGDAGWCLTARDPVQPEAGGPHVTSCALAKDFEQFGIAITDGGRYVAALPADVRPPVLRTPDGRERTLEPSPTYAIIDVQAPKGSSVVRYAKDGSTRVDPIR